MVWLGWVSNIFMGINNSEFITKIVNTYMY